MLRHSVFCNSTVQVRFISIFDPARTRDYNTMRTTSFVILHEISIITYVSQWYWLVYIYSLVAFELSLELSHNILIIVHPTYSIHAKCWQFDIVCGNLILTLFRNTHLIFAVFQLSCMNRLYKWEETSEAFLTIDVCYFRKFAQRAVP